MKFIREKMNINQPIHELDGKLFYYSFLAGARRLFEHQQELNEINVFPVPDADTGSNMAGTIRAVIGRVHPQKSFKATIDAIAEAALSGARGNSGVILAQFFYGLSNETHVTTKINLAYFAETLHKAVKYVYEALTNPVEGTMLTVIREWAAYIHSHQHTTRDFAKMFGDAFAIASQSLHETTSKLKVLASANVVDAGAKGFVVFLSGIIDLLKTGDIRDLKSVPEAYHEVYPQVDVIHHTFSRRYCTSAVLHNSKLGAGEVRKLLAEYGDSVAVAGAGSMIRLHVHANNPADLFAVLEKHGSVSHLKADDMLMQYRTANARKYNIALVTDSTCDLPAELMDVFQVNMVPLNLHFDQDQYLDKITMTPAGFYERTGRAGSFPTTSQPGRQEFVELYTRLAAHYDSVIALHLTSKFSGTWQNSLMAARQVSGQTGRKISVIDSGTLSGALGLLVHRTAKAIEANIPHDDIVRSIMQWRNKSKIFVSVKTLDYMVRGGRVSPLKGKLARLMNVKPVVSMDDEGKALLMGKAFSQKGNMKKVMRHVAGLAKTGPILSYQVLHAHHPEGADWFRQAMAELTGLPPLGMLDISPVIGLNAGRGAVAVSLMLD